jgi:alcohol dehydrogenase class IV
VRGNPVAANIEDGLAAYRAGAHDGVIAFGGGSALDAGKVIAFMSGQRRPLWDFEDVGDWWTRADRRGIAPIIAVPTTAGTGSEVGRAGVVINEATHQKKIIFHPQMMPGVVISDPELTVGLPPNITAATGIDAFVHCFEAFCAPGFHPLARTARTSRRARACWRRRAWARRRFRRDWAACTPSRIRSARISTRITA